MKNQIITFFHALTFFTRIPIPWEISPPQNFNQVNRYFSFIGLFIGLLLSGFFYFTGQYFTKDVSIILTLTFSLFLTGALHEDGLADSMDALFGGKNKDDCLRILKDSSIGTYGSLSLIASFLLKFLILREFEPTFIISVFLIIHPLSRFFATIIMLKSPYVSINSKSMGITNEFSLYSFILNAIPSILILIYFVNFKNLPYFLIPVLVIFLFRTFTIKKIGGYTGDIIGSAQQISEFVLLLILRFLT